MSLNADCDALDVANKLGISITTRAVRPPAPRAWPQSCSRSRPHPAVASASAPVHCDHNRLAARSSSTNTPSGAAPHAHPEPSVATPRHRRCCQYQVRVRQ